MKKEIFKDIQIIEKKGNWGLHKPVHTIGWKFGYKGNKYGNYISDQVGTGKFSTYWETDDDGGSREVTSEIMKTVPITTKHQIELIKNMIEVMEKVKENVYKKYGFDIPNIIVDETDKEKNSNFCLFCGAELDFKPTEDGGFCSTRCEDSWNED